MNINERLKKEEIIYCPKCSIGELKKVKMNKILSPNKKYILDECDSCGGRWFDKYEMDTMKKMGFWEYVLNYFRK